MKAPTFEQIEKVYRLNKIKELEEALPLVWRVKIENNKLTFIRDAFLWGVIWEFTFNEDRSIDWTRRIKSVIYMDEKILRKVQKDIELKMVKELYEALKKVGIIS